MKNIFRKFRQTVIHPIPNADFPPLIALDLVPEDQQELLRGFPEIKPIARHLGKTLFSLHQARDYIQGSLGLRRFLWLLMLVICAWVNVQAVRATIDNSFPAQLYLWKPVITFALSLFLIFLLDWLIGSEIKNYLSCFDAKQIEAKLDQFVKTTKGELNLAFALGEKKDAFDRVQKKYLSAERNLSLLKLGFLAVIYLVETIAALYSITLYGEGGELTAYIAPLVGVLFSGLSGLFRGITIEYAKRRHGIGYRYLNLAEEKSLEMLPREIYFANTITEAFLKTGTIDREVVENLKKNLQKAEIQAKFAQALDSITNKYHQRSLALTNQYQQEQEKLEKEQEGENNNRSVQDPAKKQLKFQKTKNRLGQNYLRKQLGLIDETQQKLNRVYRQYPDRQEADCSFQQEIEQNKQQFQNQLNRLELEWQILNNPQSDRSSDAFKQTQDDQNQEDRPFDSL
jgi:hypothetical protein